MTCSATSSPSMLHALDRAVGGAHAAADLRRLERRAGRGRGGERPARSQPERDLAVGPDVDEQPHAPVAREAGREHAGDDVAAHVGAERGEDEGRRARVHARRRSRPRRVAGSSCVVTMNGAIDSGSGSIPSASCIIVDVAADRHLVDLARARCPPPRRPRAASSADRLRARASLQRAERVGVDHRRRDARDDVGAEGLLAVEHRADRRAACRSRGRAASRRPSSCRGRTRSRSGAPVVSPGSTSISSSSHDDRGDLEVRVAQDAARASAHDLQVDRAARGRRCASSRRCTSERWSSIVGSSSSR